MLPIVELMDDKRTMNGQKSRESGRPDRSFGTEK